MQLVRFALECALTSKTSAAWDEVDRLADEVVKRGFTSADEIRQLIATALARLGYDQEDTNSRHGQWIETLLASIMKSIESSQRVRTEFVCLPFTFHSLNRDFNIVAVTKGWLDLLGYKDPSEVVGRNIDEFLSPASQLAHEISRKKNWDRGVAIGLELTMDCKDNTHLDIILDGIGIRDDHGHVTRSVSLIRKR